MQLIPSIQEISDVLHPKSLITPLLGICAGCLMVAAQVDLPIFAQTTTVVPATVSTSTVSYTFFPMLEGMTLTEDQQAKATLLAQETVSKIEAALPPEKQQQFRTSIEQKKDLRSAIQDLGDRSLMGQIFPIMKDTRAQLEAILTPEQRKQMDSTNKFKKES